MVDVDDSQTIHIDMGDVHGEFLGDGHPNFVDRRLGVESNQEIVSCRAVRACVCAVWFPSGIGSQN